MSKARIKEVLLDQETPATVLLIVSADLLGPELLQWDPMTIRLELKERLGQEPGLKTVNRLMAAIELVTRDGFYQDLPDFIRICNALFNGTVNLESWDPADAAEIAWGITEALLIWPPDPDDEEPFSDEIVAYIGEALKDEGIMVPPDVLRLGIVDTSEWGRVQGEWSDDPSMYNAIHDKEREKTEEINLLIKQRLTRVLQLLDSLPLDDGDATDAVKRMFGALSSKEEESKKLKPI